MLFFLSMHANLICKACGISFERDPGEAPFYKKFDAEPQLLCFDCDLKQRLCFRNERALYHRKCDATGETIISIYSADKPYKVYKSSYWYGDAWDALEYGRDVDFKRPFFEQLKELQLAVPRLALSNFFNENSDYCNMTAHNKNCYLVFGGDYNQDTMFGTLCMNNVSALDLDFSNYNELCYMLGDSLNCYDCQFVFDSKNCHNCYFVSDCTGCNECILCTNLVNKSYCIDNKQYSKEEYFQKKQEFLDGTFSKQQDNFERLRQLMGQRIVKYAHIVSSQNCTGDYIKNSKNCTMCFNADGSEDSKNILYCYKVRDCFNSSLLGHKSELCYEVQSIFSSYDCQFSYCVIDSSNIRYCDFVVNCQNIFGCVGLRNKKYCILNKQYTKEEYEKLIPRIIEHMKKGREYHGFLPKSLSCFGYNETTAHLYYPLKKEEALKQGFFWKDEETKTYLPQTYKVPDNIKDVSDSITAEALVCADCKKNFKIILQELKFYRQHAIPIPRLCPDCRNRLRMSLRNPRQLWSRACAKCNVAVQTTYSPERTEIVYCEACYLKEIY